MGLLQLFYLGFYLSRYFYKISLVLGIHFPSSWIQNRLLSWISYVQWRTLQVYDLLKFSYSRIFPHDPVVETSPPNVVGGGWGRGGWPGEMQVWSLVRELGSHMPCKKTQNIKQKQYFDKFNKDFFFNRPLLKNKILKKKKEFSYALVLHFL